MKYIKSLNQVSWPDSEVVDNFTFSAVHPDGIFEFTFRYFNDRWNGWCKLPSGEVRAFGVLPQVPSWLGFTDYGILFDTDLTVIDKSSLFSTSLYIMTWD